MVTYACRYSSGHLIRIIHLCQDELETKGPTRMHVSAGVDDHPCFPFVYIGIMEVRNPKISPQNQLNSYFVRSRQYWLGIAKLKHVFRSTINPSTKMI